jgi:tetratricopeptide (TPR) repeat protein
MELPDIDELWNYKDPRATELAIREVLTRARLSGNRDYHAQLLTQLARCQVLQRRYEDGLATLDEVALFLSDDTPTATVRYLLERGRAWNDTNQTEEAKSAFERAFHLAVEQRLDTLAIDAAHMLGVMRPFDEAAQWNRRAIELAERSSQSPAWRWIGTLFLNLGWNYQQLGEYGAAEQAFTQAMRAHDAAGNTERARVARLGVAKNLRLQGDAPAALVALERLLVEMQAAGEPDGYAQEEVAECLLVAGRDEEAKPFFANAFALLSRDTWFPPNEAHRLGRLKELSGSTANSVRQLRTTGSTSAPDEASRS